MKRAMLVLGAALLALLTGCNSKTTSSGAATATTVPVTTTAPSTTPPPPTTGLAPTTTAPRVVTTSAAPVITTTIAPTPVTKAAPNLCGAPPNPDGYTLCHSGSLINQPAPDTCVYFSCIKSFSNGVGYMVECRDGMYSMSGGRSGACSSHGGEKQPVYAV
jgi:hypothetical protein